MAKTTTHTLKTKDTGFLIKSLLQHRVFVGGFKLILVGTLLIVLYFQLFGREDLTLQGLGEELVKNLSFEKLPLVFFVLILMPLNWFFETKKWLALMEKIEPISIKDATKAVLAGLTFSLITPNRIGDYGGRALMVSKGKRFMSIFATLIGVFSQWIVLVVGGWWGLVGAFYLDLIPISNLMFVGLVLLGVLLTTGLFFAYFNLKKLVAYCRRFKWTQKWAERLHDSLFQHYSLRELFIALQYSLLRYITYSLQYLLLLYFFGFEASIGAALLGIMIVYLLQTGIPLPPSTGLLARGNIALMIFGLLSTNQAVSTAILASTFGLWLINVIVPALLGTFFIAKLGNPNVNKKETIHPAL